MMTRLLRGVQERLGAINDCVTTAELIDDCGVQGAGLRLVLSVNSAPPPRPRQDAQGHSFRRNARAK